MDYPKFAALANKLILSNGRLVKVQKLSAGATDSNKPWNGTGAAVVETEREVSAVFVDSKLGKELVDDNLLKTVSQVALVAPTDIDLSSATVIYDGGMKYKVDFVQVLKPADTIVLYIFGVSK